MATLGPARPWIALGATAALTAIAIGAYATHGLAMQGNPHAVDLADKAARYQIIHGMALVLCGLLTRLPTDIGRRWVHAAGTAFTLGILLFCGTLYTLALTTLPVAIVAPFGGTAFMIGWGLLAVGALVGGTRIPI